MIVLTAPELSLLENIQCRRIEVAPNFPPLKTLLRHNFVVVEQGFALRPSGKYCCTREGEEYLKSLQATRSGRTSSLSPNKSNTPKP